MIADLATAGDIPSKSPTSASPSPPPITRKEQVVFELSHPIKDLTNFNWFFRESTRDDGAQQAMWEPLFLLDYGTGRLQPWLARDLVPDDNDKDGKTWKLTLRDGVEWSDSKIPVPGKPGDRPFTSEDVAFTVRMAIGQIKDKSNRPLDLPALEAVTLRSQVEDVSAPDRLTVIFKLKRANPRFALENFGGTLFSSFLIMPKHVWDKISNLDDPSQFRPDPVGTGPYLFNAKDSTSKRVVWTRNDNWWGARVPKDPKVKEWPKELPKPAQLIWQVVESVADSQKMLAANELDAAREYSPSEFDNAKKNSNVIGWSSGSRAWNDPCARQIDINTQYVRDPKRPDVLTPWNDNRLRRALSLLIDRTALARKGYGDTTTPSKTMFAEYGGLTSYVDAIVAAKLGVSASADAAAADSLLQQAKYHKAAGDQFYKADDGSVLGTTLIVNADQSQDVAGADEVAAQLNAAGIKVDVVSIPNTEYWGRVVPNGFYEMVYGWLSCGSVAEPYTSMRRYAAKAVDIGQRSPGFDNTGRWKGSGADQYAKLVNQLGTFGPGGKSPPDLVVQAYKFLSDDMPFVPLVQSLRIIPFNTKYWKGWPTADDSYTVPMHGWLATHRIIHRLRAN